MKRIMIAGFLVWIALWCGYSVGYHHGQRDAPHKVQTLEGAQLELRGKVVVAPSHSVNAAPQEITFK